MRSIFLVSILMATVSSLFSQQVPDLTYDPPIAQPAYKKDVGTDVFIDEGHHNFHTKDGRYAPFTRLLEKDGYNVKAYFGQFESRKLTEVKILVIANALNEVNAKERNWTLPNPSAFTDNEIEVIKNWVSKGGSLFLIADHMPFAGAAEKLGATFGFTFYNGFNIDVINPAYFRASNGTVANNVITRGRNMNEEVNEIPNTEGQAFQFPEEAEPILLFGKSSLILLPDTAWNFHSKTPIVNIDGYAQGAYMKYGKGRIVVFGEASLFTAQIGEPGKRKMGMNRFDATDNHKLLLNIIHWLDGIL